jgi:CheY-like chemotaxis protein
VVALVAGEAGSFRQTLVSALARCGVRTITLDDGPAAMETARLARPRLLIVQAYLRGLCGVELIPELRSDPLLAGCRILLYGAPAPAGRWLAPPERVYGADAHVGEDIAPEALDRLLRCLLGLPGGAPPPPPDDGEMRAACRVAISDLVAADGEALDAGLRDGRFAADLTDHIELIRDWCVDRFPAPDRRSATVLTVFEEELQLALARRAPDVGAALTT